MNVNDVICVGAEPLAMLDYIAVPSADPEVCEQIGVGLARGAELRRDRDPRRRARPARQPGQQRRPLRRLLRHRRPRGDRRRRRGAARRPGDRPALLGDPLQRLHAGPRGAGRDRRSTRTPTAASAARSARSCSSRPRSTSSRCVELLRSEVDVRGLAHLTSGGLGNLLRLAAAERRLRDRRPAAGAARLRADPRAGRRLRRGDARRLQHGLRLLRHRRRRRTRTRPSPCSASTTRRRSGSVLR